MYTIIQLGKNKGRRLYDETKYDANFVLCSEFTIAFNSLINNNIDLYLLHNIPNHNIIFKGEDFKYLNQTEDEFYNIKLEVSENIRLIKNLQLTDFWKIHFIKGLEI
jgi:hypothetical protein